MTRGMQLTSSVLAVTRNTQLMAWYELCSSNCHSLELLCGYINCLFIPDNLLNTHLLILRGNIHFAWLTQPPPSAAYMRWWSRNGLSPVRRQAITWTNADLLSIGPLGTNFSEIRIQNTKLFMNENVFENVVCQNGGQFLQGDMS